MERKIGFDLKQGCVAKEMDQNQKKIKDVVSINLSKCKRNKANGQKELASVASANLMCEKKL